MKNVKLATIFCSSLLCLLYLPYLVQQGMFLDGITYATISKNLSQGIGNFCEPHYTNQLYPIFYEHPPLVFELQSVFFKIFGDQFYTERIHSLFTGIFTAIGIILCWNILQTQNEHKKYSWLPVICTFLLPQIMWSYKNNMLENTMTAFCLFSVYFFIRGLKEQRIFFILIGSLFVHAALLSKGIAGVFPIITGFIFLTFIKNAPNKRIIYYSLLCLFIPVLLSLLIFNLIPCVGENFNEYINKQLIPALNSKNNQTTKNHFSILSQLFLILVIPIFITLIMWFKNKISFLNKSNAHTWIYLSIGLCASLPLAISLKQREYYLVPSLPFFMLAFSSVIVNIADQKINSFIQKFRKGILIISLGFILTTITLMFLKFGKISRDEKLIYDTQIICSIMETGAVIYTENNLCNNWQLIAYLARFKNISLDCNNERSFMLRSNLNNNTEDYKNNYSPIDLPLENYRLYKKNL